MVAVIMIVRMVVAAAAIRSVLMIVMMMRVVMPVIVRMAMVMTVRMRGFFRVGAAFGIERSFDARYFRAQFHHQFFEHMVATDSDAVGENLRGHMTITEMPGDARKVMRIARSDFGDRLAGSNNAHDATIFKPQAVAIVQHRGFGEIEQKHGVFRAAHRDAAAVTAVMRQLDAVGFPSLIPVTGG